MRGRFCLCDGTLHYATMGQGNPVVLLLKLGGWIADWRRIALRLIAATYPGRVRRLALIARRWAKR
jgi:hypothetical protein